MVRKILFTVLALTVAGAFAAPIRYDFEMTSITSISDGAGIVPAEGVDWEGTTFSFVIDLMEPGARTNYKGTTYVPINTESVDYFYADYTGDPLLEPPVVGFYTKPGNVSAYNFGFNRYYTIDLETGTVRGNYRDTYVYGGFQDITFLIVKKMPPQLWDIGTTVNFAEKYSTTDDLTGHRLLTQINGKAIITGMVAVPEPQAIYLILSGFLPLALLWRKRAWKK
jgi:hypothetical protein